MDIERNIVVIKKSVHINNKFKKSLSNKTLLCICYCKTVIFTSNIWTGSVCLTSPPPQGYFTSDTYSQLPGEVWNWGLTMKYWPVASQFTCTPARCALFFFARRGTTFRSKQPHLQFLASSLADISSDLSSLPNAPHSIFPIITGEIPCGRLSFIYQQRPHPSSKLFFFVHSSDGFRCP